MRNTTDISSSLPAGWNEFVEQRPCSHFEQFSWWSAPEATDHWNALYAIRREGGQITAGAMILTRQMNKIGRIGYVFRGPFSRKPADSGRSTNDLTCALLKDASQLARLRFLVVVPPYDAADFSQYALNTGFSRHPDFLPPSRLPVATITVDLRKHPDLIEKSFRRSTRQEIRAGRRAGVVVEMGGPGELDEFWDLHEALCRRRGIHSNIPSRAYIHALWSAFAANDRAWMFRASHAGESLCSLICLKAGTTCYAWRIGWSGAHADKYPTKVLYAEAMRYAAAAGCEQFDFMGIDPAVVAALQRGEKPIGADAGITVFKLGFSGVVATLPTTLIWFPNSVIRLLFKCLGLPLLQNAHIRKFVLKRS